ncbi:hypothetical protein [Tautonia marina]|uniref:hypothetical protein n=1 Tax=Tautonia marina TaxID=2653855 RepID=UPI0012611CC5|nr:hypothetical protein [Tautonia marina]
MSYEFTPEQNTLIGNLAHKMGVVGLLAMIVGILNLISALMLLVFVFQDQIPAEVVQQIPEEIRGELPPTNFLWGLAIQSATSGLIFTLLGVWTRAAAGSFREIVATTGRDVGHLMNALGSVYKMYSLLYALVVIALIFFVVGLALQFYLRFTS